VSYILSTLHVPKERLGSESAGRDLLERFARYFPEHTLQKFGEDEPLRHAFDADDLQRVLRFWGPWYFIAARRKHPCSALSVTHALDSPYTPHRSIHIHLQFDDNSPANNASAREFLYETSNALGADYAAAHVSPRAWAVDDIDEVLRTRPSICALTTEIKTKRLRRNIPNLYWLTVFGLPYVELFGKDRILQTPAFAKRELEYGGIGVELAEGIEDTVESFEKFESLRETAKRYLGSNAFYEKSLAKHHVYNAPTFGAPAGPPADRRERYLALAAQGESGYDAILYNPDEKKRPNDSP
jgi:hypothetical protein